MKKLIKKGLDLFGYQISKKKIPINISSKNINSMEGGLIRSKERGFNPSTIIDIGAASGTWTKRAMEIWPNSRYILFEPLEERRAELELLKNQNKDVHIYQALAGKEKGAINFTVSPDLDGSGVYDESENAENLRRVDVMTIDQAVNETNATGPFLIKLDTHGFELPILEGATKTLNATELLIVEVYGFKISPHALLFWEICGYLDKLNLRVVDMVDLMRRKSDQAFWQSDFSYLKVLKFSTQILTIDLS
jgi:FkbM family methyltransferase